MSELERYAKGHRNNDGHVEGAWFDTYLDLKAAGLHWKKAAFSAWYNAPKSSRQPGTMVQLAELLNYKSEQVFYKWKQADWFQELGIEQYRESIFTRYVADVDRKTIAAALTEDGSPGVAARKLFYEQAGLDRQSLEITGRDGEEIKHKMIVSSAEIAQLAKEAAAAAAEWERERFGDDDE